MDIDDYEIHSDLVEKFILNGDKTAFRKMLNMNLTSVNNNKAAKQKENILKKNQFMKSLKQKKPSPFYYNNFHMNHFNNNNFDTYKPGDINTFKLDLHNILQDPEYKDKCMKGNYKWGNMRFQMMKANLAKRKGISVDELKMPKIWGKKKSSNMEMNGNYIMQNKDNNRSSFGKYTFNKKINKNEDNKNNYQLYNDKMMTMNKKMPSFYKKQLSQTIQNKLKTSNSFNI